MVRSSIETGGKAAMRRILFVSGSRADFGKLLPLILASQEVATLDVCVFVTGAHCDPQYGDTLNHVRREDIRNLFVFPNYVSGTVPTLPQIVASTILGLTDAAAKLGTPDLIVVHGDRSEALAGAIFGSLNNIRVAHVEGGELSGSVDDAIRHAITKLSHIHFTANEDAADRLLKLGEEACRIFILGSPEVDVMLSGELPEPIAVRRAYGIPFQNYALLIYHPVASETRSLKRNVEALLAAVRESGDNFVALYPNNEIGSEIILQQLRLCSEQGRLVLLASMPSRDFFALLRNASYIVGNSSAGVREAPVFGVPTINVGTRQSNRNSSPGIVHVSEEALEIAEAIRSIPTQIPSSFPFGNGRSASKFTRLLGKPEFWRLSTQKCLDPVWQSHWLPRDPIGAVSA
jgi:UDP-N-acetylglucosamine 2-epimerase (hydrolysing)